MNDHTKIYISLGAATAANCIPCFEHYVSKAKNLGFSTVDIEKAVEIAVKVRGGAHMVMKDAIGKILQKDESRSEHCCSGDSACC